MNPTSKQTLLQLAKYYTEQKGKRFADLSWTYLFCWAFYDHWIENYWNEE
jgi:hypothetical protein